MHHDVQVVPERLAVLFRNHDPEPLKRPQHQLDVVVHERKEEVDEVLPFLRPQDADNPEIQKDDVAFFGHEQVARVGVTMEEPVLKNHLQVGMEPPHANLVRVKAHLHHSFGIIDPDSLDKFHDHDLGRRELPVDLRETDARHILEVACHPVRVAAVPGEVKLFYDLVGKIVDHAGRVVQAGLGKNDLEAFCHRLQDTDIGLDDIANARALDLDCHRSAIGEESAVDLPDRGGCDRRLLDAGKPDVHIGTVFRKHCADF